MTTAKDPRIPRIMRLLLLAAALYPLLISSTAGGSQIAVQWEFDPEDVRLEQSGAYICVTLKDAVFPENTPGTPWLPAKYVNVLIPPDATITDIELAAIEDLCIASDVLVYPVQEPQQVSEPPRPFVYPNPEVYSSEEKIPLVVGSSQGVNYLHGYSLAAIRLNPFHYIPSKRELYFATRIVANITFGASDLSGTRPRIQRRTRQEVVEIISNPQDIDLFYPIALTERPRSSNQGILAYESAPDDSAVYLLVTSDELAEAFQPLVDRRTEQGLTGKLVTVESIELNYPGLDIQEQIRSCVKNHYENHGTIYVTLGGDDAVVPDRDCYVGGCFDMPTDLYYGGLNGTWDEDGDGIYGEAEEDNADLYPEVWVGRIPVRTGEQATDYINKLITYEDRSPEGFSNTMLITGVMDGQYASGTEIPSGYIGHDPVSYREIKMVNVYREHIQPYWQATPVHKLLDTISTWDSNQCGDYDVNGEHLAERLSWGYHHVFVCVHGAGKGWGAKEGGEGFNTRDAMDLTNTGRPSIIYSESCKSGAFDLVEPSLSEALLRNPHGGAVVYVGSSRVSGISYSLTRSDPRVVAFYRELFVNKRETIGEAFAHYKMSWAARSNINNPSRWVQFSHNLQADSALRLLSEETMRDLHVSSPNGCEIFDLDSDLEIRWNASGTDFAPDEKVRLEYSLDGGLSWEGIPGAEQLPYNGRLFRWEACALQVGSEYRIRVTSLVDPTVSDASDRDFRIGDLGFLTVRSAHALDVRIEGPYSNSADYDINVLRGEVVTLKAPQMEDLEFIRWSDGNRNTLTEEQEYTFTFKDDTVVVAEYVYPTRVYYVNDETPENGIAAGNDENDGLTPQTSMRHIQAVLECYPNLRYGDVIEISSGIYYENITLDANNTGLELKGVGPGFTTIDGGQNGICIYLDGFSVGTISGLTVRNGFSKSGGGIYCRNSSPTISACLISKNHSNLHGGGISIAGSSHPKIIDCTFINNHCDGRGGAVDIRNTASPELISCIFTSNSSSGEGGVVLNTGDSKAKIVECLFSDNNGGGGGAICNHQNSAPVISSCVLDHNHSTTRGGAIMNMGECSPIIENCLIFQNSANRGGGIANDGHSAPIIANCTFTKNSAGKVPEGGGLHAENTAGTMVTNCIFWNNIGKSVPELYVNSKLTISYTNVKGGQAGISVGPDAVLTWGDGNIDADPLFADAANDDYHLKSQAGRRNSNSESWVIDNFTSPCIDAGDPDTLVGDEPEPNGGRVNMGAYCGTPEASKSP